MIDTTQLGFKIIFREDLDPNQLRIEDITNFGLIGGGYDNTMYAAKLEGYMPNGDIFTNNVIDIDPDGVGSIADFSLPLDTNGNFYKGSYLLKYHITLAKTSSSLAVASEDVPSKSITVAGDQTGTYPPTAKVILSYPNGSYKQMTVVTSVFTTVTTLVFEEDLVAGATVVSLGEFIEETLTEMVDYQHTTPTLKIELPYSCDAAWLQSIDATDYGANVDTVTYTSHVVKWPVNMSPPPADVTDTAKQVVINSGLYTGVYTSVVNSVALYAYTNYYVQEDYSFTESTEIVCDDLGCLISCFLDEKRKAMQVAIENGNDTTEINQLVTFALLSYNSYKAYVLCGNTEAAAGVKLDLTAFLEECGCECDGCTDDDTSMPRLITAITGTTLIVGSGSGNTFNFYVDSGVPTPGLGDDGDKYLDIDTGNIYDKVSGSWQLKGSIMGAAGATGATGATGAAGSNGTNGDSAYVYLAFADDAAGANFNPNTPVATSKFLAFITSTSVIASPVAGDFAGAWAQYDFSGDYASFLSGGLGTHVNYMSGENRAVLNKKTVSVKFALQFRVVTTGTNDPQFVVDKTTFPVDVTKASNVAIVEDVLNGIRYAVDFTTVTTNTVMRLTQIGIITTLSDATTYTVLGNFTVETT